LDPQELVDPRCSICGATPEFRESEHFFLKLSAFEKPLLEWVEKQDHWRNNVKNFTRQFLRDGLKDRAISRDLSWGVPLPVDGYESKRIYVWFEAVIGYLSAAVEWAGQTGGNWEDFWKDPATKSYYFIGKDNIPFHSIIWPAIILAYDEGLNLPYDVPANEFLSLENQKFSTSQNWAVWVPDYLERYDPDPLRYLLSINMPESGDANFSWSEFVRRNNEELVATYGNLVNRVLSFTYRNFDGKVPGVQSLDEVDEGLLRAARETMDSVDENLYHCRFKAAIGQAFGLAQEANRYLDTKAPWKTIKEDRDQAGACLTVAMQAINCLKTILYPFMPFSSQKVHEFLGFDGPVEEGSWDFEISVAAIKAGASLREPSPLYTKLDPEIIGDEVQKLGTGTSIE
jgi:methionyl-tRNA synthetase